MIFGFMRKSFCPRCGVETDKLFSGFCVNCFLEQKKPFVFPQKLQVDFCVKCGKVKYRNKLLPFSDKVFFDLVKANSKFSGLESPTIDLKQVQLNEKNAIGLFLVAGFAEGEKFSVEKSVQLDFMRVTCEDCSRVAGKYFEAIIQARFQPDVPKKEFEKKFAELEKVLSSNAEKDGLSKIVRSGFVSNGFDAYIGSKKAAKKAIGHFEKELKEQVKVSFKLHGWDLSKNRPMKRLTFSLRF